MTTLPAASLNAYFDRIGFDGTPRADLATLQQLHARHPVAIPFENLNSWRGESVDLAPGAVFDKLVTRRRGGYCFEHNLLFMQVLQSLGLPVRGLSARVLWMLPEHVTLPRTHMALLVTIGDTPYLADVGFGGLTMTAPLRLDDDTAQQTPHEALRLERQEDGYRLLAQLNGQWQPMFRFGLDEQLPVDYETANWYVSTHPQSRFVTTLIAARPDGDGRHALMDRRYTRHSKQQDSVSRELDSPEELLQLLREAFAIDIATLPGLREKADELFGNAS